MQSFVQPLLRYSNANLESFSRYANANDIAQIAKTAGDRYLQYVQEGLRQVVQTEAATEYSRALISNYTKFMNESAQALLGIASDTQEFINEQFERSAWRWKQAGEVANNFVDASAAMTSGTMRSSRDAAERASSAIAKAAKASMEGTEEPVTSGAGAARPRHQRK